MKKIPTLFERVFDNHHKVGINNKGSFRHGMGSVRRRHSDRKNRRQLLCGDRRKFLQKIRCKTRQDSAGECGSLLRSGPHNRPLAALDSVDESDKINIWFMEAYRNADCPTEEGTYEAIGPHFRANPYGLEKDVIEKHGIRILLDVPRDFEGIRDYLEKHNIEGHRILEGWTAAVQD